jgi:integrase
MTFHDLRHTAATLAAQNGATTAELMRRLGHTTASMAMRYQHSSAQRDRQIAEALSSLLKSEEK